MAKKRLCGNPTCGSSTGIHGGLTFGHGRLDEHGFWEFPCRVCAAAFDDRKPQIRTEVEAEGHDLREQEWLLIPAWPTADQDCAELTRDIQTQLAKDDVKWAEFDSELETIGVLEW